MAALSVRVLCPSSPSQPLDADIITPRISPVNIFCLIFYLYKCFITRCKPVDKAAGRLYITPRHTYQINRNCEVEPLNTKAGWGRTIKAAFPYTVPVMTGYLVLSDESFSLASTLETPDGLDTGRFCFALCPFGTVKIGALQSVSYTHLTLPTNSLV